MEYATRTLANSASTGSLHERRNNDSARTLTPSASADSLHKSGSQRKLITALINANSPASLDGVRNLPPINGPTSQHTLTRQCDSLTSLLSVDSDASAPQPMAPPRSAQLNTGEVLQPYQPSHLQAAGASFAVPSTATATVVPQAHFPVQSPPLPKHAPPVWQNLGSSRNSSTSSLTRSPATTIPMNAAMAAAATPLAAPAMALVHPQAAISSEGPPRPERAVASIDRASGSQPPTPTPPSVGPQVEPAGVIQSTWVIEEVVDFGVPLDEGGVRECEDTSYPLGCRNLSVGISPRNHGTMFDGCVRSVCYDEEQVMAMHSRRQEGKDFC